ncbi:coiled-coil domain-containing protein [Lignipirellula cremea]|nr:hypothetical protein [Lignipirellula cremea]
MSEFSAAFDACRERAQLAVQTQRERVREVENEFETHVRALLAELESERDQLRVDRADLERRRDETSAQRKSIARDLRAQRAEMLAEIEQKRAERMQSDTGESNGRVAELQAECDRLRSRFDQEDQQWRDAEQQVEHWRNEAQQLSLQAEEAEQRVQEREQVIEHLRRELEQALQQLDEVVAQGAQGGASDAVLEDMRRGREMAIDELRELKKKNEELQTQLAAKPAVVAGAPVAGMGMDWAAQKARMLQQLEDDFDPENAEQVRERLTIEKTLQTTEKLLSAKENELNDLRQLLEDQSASIGGMAVGANAIAELLDHDELVREERDNLKKVQEEWRQKLRVAEVDISVERAKLARERAELEDRLQRLEQEKAKMAVLQPADTKSKPPTRNKWLARLGLRDDDAE